MTQLTCEKEEKHSYISCNVPKKMYFYSTILKVIPFEHYSTPILCMTGMLSKRIGCR